MSDEEYYRKLADAYKHTNEKLETELAADTRFIERWQAAIHNLCREHYPEVDGSGCESGDELDFSLAEIKLTLVHIINKEDDRIIALEAENKRKDAVVEKAKEQRDALWAMVMKPEYLQEKIAIDNAELDAILKGGA